jgi:hypothetical protein
MKLKVLCDVKASDEARVEDLVGKYGLPFKRVGKLYVFADFNAWNLDQALGYVEGYDRAMAAAGENRLIRNDLECRQCGGDEFYGGTMQGVDVTVRESRKAAVQCSVCLNCGHVFTFVDDSDLDRIRAWKAEGIDA